MAVGNPFVNRYNLSVVPFRLTLATGVGFPDTNQTAQSTIYWTPYGGNAVALYNGSSWNEYIVTEKSLALSGLTPWRLYDIFVYDNAGTVTLESLGWTAPASGTITGCTNATPAVVTSNAHGRAVDDMVYITGVVGSTGINSATGIPARIKAVTANTFTLQSLAAVDLAAGGAYVSGGTWYLASKTDHARATALTTQDGIDVKTGSTTRRYLGTFCATSATTTDDDQNSRLLWNRYCGVYKHINRSVNSSHSYNGGIRPWNNDLGNRFNLVTGLQSESGLVTVAGIFTSGGANFQMETGVGLDVISSYSAVAKLVSNATSIGGSVAGATYNAPTAGFHFCQAVENTNTSGSSTFSSVTLTSTCKC